METFWAHDAVHGGVGLVLVHGDDGVLVLVHGDVHELVAGEDHELATGHAGGLGLDGPGHGDGLELAYLPTGQIAQALPTDRVRTAYWSGSASTAHWLLAHRKAVVGEIWL